jgi:hypothetical protein
MTLIVFWIRGGCEYKEEKQVAGFPGHYSYSDSSWAWIKIFQMWI